MNGNKHIEQRVPPLSLQQKRQFLLGLTDPQIRDLLHVGSAEDFEAIGHELELRGDQIRQIASNPQTLKGARLNPNRLRREQLEQVPGLPSTAIDTILQGKPYYSLDELELVSSFARSTLHDLFEIRPYRYADPITGQVITLEPVPGHYIVPSRDFETNPALAAGYADVYAASSRVRWRVVEAVEFEATSRPHMLKREFGGQVYPVMRDGEGFQRYLVPGSVDVWFQREVPEATRAAILEALHLDVTESVADVGYYRTRLARIPQNANIIHTMLDTIAAAIQRPEVHFAEPDQLGFEDFGPDLGDSEDEHEFESLELPWNEAAINLAGAHAITQGSPDVTVFTIDSGCYMDHESLEPGFRADWERLDLSFDLGEAPEVTSPDERDIAHGTQVTGVIRRVAPGCRILPVKIPGNAGGTAAPGYGLRAAAIVTALDYVAADKRAVLNMSWKTNGEHIGIREALRSAEARGVVLVASAGNYRWGTTQRPDELHYPSAYTYRDPINRALLSVAALGPGDVRASYSYYGSDSITVSAPGGEWGGVDSRIYTTSTPASHTYVIGTSFAAPHVAGIAALLFSVRPDLSAEQVIAHIKDTADNIDGANPGFRGQLGTGRINALAALERAVGPAPMHIITATAGSGGAVVPEGAVSVPSGGAQRFEFVPDPGYAIADVLVDGHSIGTPTAYNLTSVSADHTLAVTFVEQPVREEPQDLVNINTATAAALAALPYIGAWLAAQIVSYRQTHGQYGSIWDLSAVGMSTWAIRQIATLITV